MALKRLLAQRLFGKSRITNSAVTNCRVSSPCTAALSNALNNQTASSSNKLGTDPGEDGIFRRYHHRQSGATPPSVASLRFLPTGGKLLETIREMDIARNRQSAAAEKKKEAEEEEEEERRLTVKDALKILRVSQLEFIKARLREIEKDHISYSEFMEICSNQCSSDDQAIELAKMLDQSGSVIVLGNIVYLRPEQVVKAIQSLIPVSPHSPNHDDPRMIDELQEMEKEKEAIDTKAKSLVQHELWCGLASFVVQTAAFMRLTFWELSWDVMEPICFFVTSMQFMAAYAFFIRTSKEPSFESFFQSRFLAKQKRLIRARNFDIERYNELKRASHNPAACSTKPTSNLEFHTSPAMQ